MNLLAIPALASAAYQSLTLVAGVRHLLRRRSPPFTPSISILKPVRGSDERFAAAIESHAVQDYPDFEILFGMTDPDDPAREAIEALARAHPSIPIRVIHVETTAANPKVGVLGQLAKQARHPYLLVNDSDILVDSDYLRQVMAPLADSTIGLVTCLYRGSGGSFATRSEGLGIATEFAPSVLLARFIGVNEFAMGSTLAFRAADWERAGGFAAISDYLGDDYQLGKGLTKLGLQVELGRPVVATWLGRGDWRVCLVAPTPLGADHPRLSTWRSSRLRNHVHAYVGAAGCGHRQHRDRHLLLRRAHDLWSDSRRLGSPRCRSSGMVLVDAVPRSFRVCRLDGRAVRRHRGMARKATAH